MNNSSPKHICLFNSCKTWGGGEKWYMDVAINLKSRGYDIFLCTNNPSELYNKIALSNISVFPITIRNLSFLNPIKILKLIFLFRNLKIETIILGLSSDVKCAGIAARLAGVKEIIYRRGLASPIKNTWLNQFLFKYVVTKVITNSNEVKKRFLEKNPNLISTSKIHTIYNGIDINLYERHMGKNGFHKLESCIILGNSGRLIEEKGQKYLIELAQKLMQYSSNFTIQIAGKGKLRQTLQAYAKKLGVEKFIEFLDFIDDTDTFYRKIDIFVFPSLSEGFSNALLEAMAAGKPVVAFDVSSMPEIIENGITGYLVPFGDIEAMSYKVIYLMEHPEIGYKMGSIAKQKVTTQFDLNKNLYQLEAIL